MAKTFKKRVAEFWDIFAKEECEIRNMIDNKADANSLVSFVGNVLNVAFTDPYFQLGKNKEDKYELILTPEGDRARLLQLHYCVDQAPEDLKKIWNFYSSKPASPIEHNSLEMYNISIISDDVAVYYEIDKGRSKINIQILSPKLMNLEENERYNMFFIFLDQFIGELYTMEYIGYIDFVEAEQNLPVISIVDFKDLIDRIIKEQNWNPLNNPFDLFMGYQLKPNEDEGWKLREDVYIGMTSCVPVVNKFLQKDESLFSTFVNDGVVFGYLFYENINISQDRMVPQRSEIEDKILALTNAQGIAYSIGGATGFHFSYMDFMIFDFEAFKAVAEEVLLSYDFEEIGYADFKVDATPQWLR